MRPTVLILMIVLISFFFSSLAFAEKSEDRELSEIRKMIEEKGYHWTAGKTSVSGLSDEEKRLRCGYVPPPEWMVDEIPEFVASGDTIFDQSFDWRMFGCVTPAKDQRGCGSCWVFSAIGEYESHMLIYDGRYSDVSEQAILSCITTPVSCCTGGWPVEAYRVIMEQGAVSEACMPYESSVEPPCRIDECTILGSIADYYSVGNNVQLIKEAVLRGPVATTFEVYYDFFYYESGCYEHEEGPGEGAHSVIIVGWDDRMCGGEGAWICKNSWGEDWGMNGFFFIKYGTGNIGYNTSQLVYQPSDVMLEVGSPVGGENFVEGSEIDVTWITNRDREQPDYFNVYLSMDGGGVYDIPVALGLTNNDPVAFCLPTTACEASILVTGILAGEIGGMDTSDSAFTITRDTEEPFIEVLSPAGGETCCEGETLEIEWIATDNATVASIEIYYSTNGVNTVPISFEEENDSFYEWEIPPLDYDSLYIRVIARDVNGLYSIDTSDGPFYLTDPSTGAENEGQPGHANRLEQNYPNPFNGTTTIAYSVAERCDVDVRIYDTSGRLVRILERTSREPGSYETIWLGKDDAGRDVASGVYYCRIDAGAFRETRKIVYLR